MGVESQLLISKVSEYDDRGTLKANTEDLGKCTKRICNKWKERYCRVARGDRVNERVR